MALVARTKRLFGGRDVLADRHVWITEANALSSDHLRRSFIFAWPTTHF